MKQALILEKVRLIRNDQPKIGAIKLRVKLQEELKQEHLSIGRDCFFGYYGKMDYLLNPNDDMQLPPIPIIVLKSGLI
jgi:hypothetical protein